MTTKTITKSVKTIFKKTYISFGLLLTISLIKVYSQKKTHEIHTIAFYNLENLFDTINNPKKLDEKSPIMGNSPKQRSIIYQKKISNMAKVISEIGVNKKYSINSPTIIGLCEIENDRVLNDLISEDILHKKYDYIHFDSPDIRGIDVALLYRKNQFSPINFKKYELKLYNKKNNKRIFTRDQLVVSGLLNNEKINFIVTHWPSRRGGEANSRPKRIKAAILTRKIIDSIQNINPYAKIIIMGDFNDNPFNTSIKKLLKTKSEREKVGRTELFNPMMKMTQKGVGTLAYRDELNLFDQILFSQSLIDKDYKTYKIYKTGIFNPLYITIKKGRYKGYPFRSFVGSKWSNGYSDHFPVYTYIIKEIY